MRECYLPTEVRRLADEVSAERASWNLTQLVEDRSLLLAFRWTTATARR